MLKKILIFASILLVFLFCAAALADEEPEIIDLVPVDKTLLKPIPTPPPKKIHIESYTWSSIDIDAVASVFWAETGSGDQNNTLLEKRAIAYVIYNRYLYGDPFDNSSIAAICKQKGEFNYGRVSDRNRKIAENALNSAKSQADGYYTGDEIPTTAMYIGRDDGDLVLYDIHWQSVYRIEKAK